MVLGPDGAMYVSVAVSAESSQMWRLDSNGDVTAKFSAGLFARTMTVGSDRALWMIPYTGEVNFLERFSLNGTYRDFKLPQRNASLTGITPGSHGALWFTDYFNNDIGRITTSGAISLFPMPAGCVGQGPIGIAACPGGCEHAHVRLWFTQQNAVGRLEY